MANNENNSEQAIIARREAAKQMQQDLRLSLAKTHSLPDILMTAPWAVNLIGQIKLLAFSDNALRINLEEPMRGFQHLRYPSMSSAMIQIVDQAGKAFGCASKNLRVIRLQSGIMFGRDSHMQDILLQLQDPQNAKSHLLTSVTKFHDEMQKCAELALEIDGEFQQLVATASEANEAMSHKLSTAQIEQEKIVQDVNDVKKNREKTENIKFALRDQLSDAKDEYAEAKKRYDTEMDRGEMSAFMFGALEDARNAGVGIVNATISAIKGLVRHGGDSRQIEIITSTTTTPGIDPALHSAPQMECQLNLLQELLDRDSKAFMTRRSEFRSCVARLQELKYGLGAFQSEHTRNAKQFVGDAIDIARTILDLLGDNVTEISADNQEVERWRNSVSKCLVQATELVAFAAAQPGFGFGSSLDTSQDTGQDRVLGRRYQKLVVAKTAMQVCRTRMEKNAEAQLAAQNRVIDLVRNMEQLDHKKGTIEDTKRILRDSVDAMMAMQSEVRRLAEFFTILAEIASIAGTKHAERFLDGVIGGGDPFSLAYSENQARLLRETMFTLRGHFAFVVRSADLYEEINREHIAPCLRMATLLPISASPEKQNDAKLALAEQTQASAEAIKKIAQEEMKMYQGELEKRCQDIDADLKLIELPEMEPERLQAIKDGVNNSSKVAEERAAASRPPALWDAIEDDL